MKKRYILLAAAAAVGGYLYSGLPLPSSHSDDSRIAYVFAREGLGSSQCVDVGIESRDELLIPLRQPDEGPPLQLNAQRFESDKVQRVAAQLASGDFTVVRPKVEGIQIGPDADQMSCFSSISSIIVVEDVAIVRYLSPRGTFGVYAFHKGMFGWRAVERVEMGWW